MNGKVFCIGLNKTGTSSLHAAFRILGLKSVHYQDETGASIKDVILDNFLAGRYILQGIEGYDAYSDWDKAPHTIDVFKEFDRQCPGSKFIVNTRELEAWLTSRERHVQRQQQEQRRHPDRDVPWLQVDREGWARQYRDHYAAVAAHFRERPDDVLVFDVAQGHGWAELCSFLGFAVPEVPFPKRNALGAREAFLANFKDKIGQSGEQSIG